MTDPPAPSPTGALADPGPAARPLPVRALLVAGAALGVVGDAALRAPGPFGLGIAIWVAAIASAAVLMQRRAGGDPDRERLTWLAMAALFAAGLAWRDSPALKLLALGVTTLSFAIAAYHPVAAWVRTAGVTHYARAWATGALHAWTAAALVLVDARHSMFPPANAGASAWTRAAPVARGLALAAPLVAVFGALFMSADAVFARLVTSVVRIDVEWAASHLLLFALAAWLTSGYLRGFVTGTALPPVAALWPDRTLAGLAAKRPTLPIAETAIALGAIDLLFLVFVIVQFRYLFGGDALVQVTPDLTYAEYARRGFFELVVVAGLVVPVLLAADWLLARRQRRDVMVWRLLAGAQIALVLVITTSALAKLRLYYASYGLTESRFYATALLVFLTVTLLWFAATVLRGRRQDFAFGVLTAGLATVALLFALDPDAVVARANVARLTSVNAAQRFDVAYATRLSGDAVPVLLAALPALPPEAQCPLARHLLRRWPPEREWSLRVWNWSADRAATAVREHALLLRALSGPNQPCAGPERQTARGAAAR